MIISFNQFLLLKEFHYQDTFGKRDKFYLEWRRLMKNMNKSDKRRFMHLRELGCVACGSNNVVIHHIRKHRGVSLRPDHQDTIPLSPKHHNMGNESIHLNKRLFEKKFGTEKQLLIKTNMKINELERNYLFYGKGNK